MYVNLSDYYFKIDKEWFFIESASKMAKQLGLLKTFKHQYPEKVLETRMVPLKDHTTDFLSAKARQENKGFMELKKYQQVENQKGKGINPIDYSAGYYYINIYMPQGDTIKFKRFGSMGYNFSTYKIPAQHGGSNEVLFIKQTPEFNLYPKQEWGGMYVIRPRDLTKIIK